MVKINITFNNTCLQIPVITYELMGLCFFHAYKICLYKHFVIAFSFSFTPVKRKISLSIDEIFDASLNNTNSDKFKKYKSDIEKAVSVK